MKGPPVLHASRHENGGADEISVLGLVGTVVFVPYNAKIADITHADTNLHYLDLAAALTETRNIIKILISEVRIAGTDWLYFYPNEGATAIFGTGVWMTINVCPAVNSQRLKYNLGFAGDDFDIYCFGYWVKA